MHTNLLTLTLLLAAATAEAQVAPGLGPATNRSLTSGAPYVHQSYSPPATVTPVTRAKSSLATPESAFIAHASAMLAGDHAWWLSGWTAADQTRHAREDAAAKRTPQMWLKIWQQALAGKSVQMLEKLQYRDFTIIVFRLVEGRTTAVHAWFVCRREGGEWRATNDLAAESFINDYFAKFGGATP
jgi:hypothetical protein